MDKLYYKLGLIDYLTINARIDKKEFIERLKGNLSIRSTSVFLKISTPIRVICFRDSDAWNQA